MTTNALPGELREDENFTSALYRAAIGPVSTDFYLALFNDWEAAGRWRPRWNTAAGVWTLGWLVFRQMGGVALAYAGAVVGSLLLIFGIGSLLLSLSDTAQWVLFGLWLAVAILVPGLWGNHWFHQHCRKRMDAALAAQPDVAQACADLAAQSSPRKKARVIGGVQVAMLLALGLASMQFSNLLHGPGFPLAGTSPSPQTASGKVNEMGEVLSSNVVPASAPTAPMPTATASKPTAVLVKAAAPTPTPAATLAPASQRTASGPTVKMATAARYGVNVGLFSKLENAQSAQSKLEGAELPVLRDTLKMPRGPRFRVRVGPFATQAEADAAVTRIRALGLDALNYRE